jgi:uncharacterized protein DUF1524
MRPLVPAMLALALALGGCVEPTGPPGPAASAATAQLDALTVAAPQPMTGYSRERFPHWRKGDGNCDVRDVVLKRDGDDIRTSGTCNVVGGRWLSPYDRRTLTAPDEVDVDHVVPLADAWRSGADTWSDERRADFANDLVRPELRAVSRTVNRAKGDQDPSQWRPSNHGYWCEYSRSWVAVKYHWTLTVTGREKAVLKEMLGSCRAHSSEPPTSWPGPAG